MIPGAKQLRMLLKTRVRIRHNISAPLLIVILFPLILLATSAGLFLHLTGNSIKDIMTSPTIWVLNDVVDAPFVTGCQPVDNSGPRANAALVVLARNEDLEGIQDSMRQLERHWNRWFNYPYVFLNDEPFNSTFQEKVKLYTNSTVEFGVIDPKDWNFPAWADEDDIEQGIQRQGDDAIMYGSMESYHKMCRFYSGKFYNHKLLLKYDWYWRVEPDVKFFCDITYDPFMEMEKNNKVYGFNVLIHELIDTVPNLFRHTVGFKNRHNLTTTRSWDMFLSHPTDEQHIDQYERKQKEREKNNKHLPGYQGGSAYLDAAGEWADWAGEGKPHPSAMNGEVYNLCHFWSNFEIARFDFFRSKQYSDFFEELEKTGGFWNERWGDAPVHSLAVGLFLEPEQIHYFRDIGYRHSTIQHCPANAIDKQLSHIPYFTPTEKEGRLSQKSQMEEDDFWSKIDPAYENGVGCRCRCDTDLGKHDIEVNKAGCIPRWVGVSGGFITEGSGNATI